MRAARAIALGSSEEAFRGAERVQPPTATSAADSTTTRAAKAANLVGKLRSLASDDARARTTMQGGLSALQRTAQQHGRTDAALASARQKLEAVSRAHSDAVKQVAKLKARADSATSDKLRLLQDVSDAKRGMQDVQRRCEDQLSQIGQLEAKLQQQAQQLRREESARAVAEAGLKDAEAAMEQVRQAVRAEEARRRAELGGANQAAAELQEELQTAVRARRGLQVELERVKRDMGLQLQQLEATYKATQKQNEETIQLLTRRLTAADEASTLARDQAGGTAKDLAAVRQELVQTRKELVHHQQRAASANAEVGVLTTRLHDLEGELAHAMQAIADGKDSAATSATALKQERDLAMGQLAAARAAASADATRMEHLLRGQRQLQDNVVRLEDRCELLERSNTELTSERDAMRAQRANETSELREQVSHALAERDLAKRKLEEALRASASQVSSARKWKADVERLQQDMRKMQDDAAQERRLWKRRLERLGQQEKEMQTAVAKLAHVDQAVKSELTCMSCLEVFNRPVTLIPCGHTYCTGCEEAYRPRCEECGEDVRRVVPNDRLETIGGKAIFISQAVTQLQGVRITDF